MRTMVNPITQGGQLYELLPDDVKDIIDNKLLESRRNDYNDNVVKLLKTIGEDWLRTHDFDDDLSVVFADLSISLSQLGNSDSFVDFTKERTYPDLHFKFTPRIKKYKKITEGRTWRWYEPRFSFFESTSSPLFLFE